MYKVFLIIILFFFNFTSINATSNQALIDLFQESFNSSINSYMNDYSAITGLYTTMGQVKGSASIGGFPSFRVGATFGTIFMNNPINFIKKLQFSTTNWDSLKSDKGLSYYTSYLSWFDSNCLPLPITKYNFEIGLFKGFSVGGNFNINPVGSFFRANPVYKTNVYEILFWGIGVNFSYTILKEFKYFPSISIGGGVDYSDVSIWIDKISIGGVFLDPTNSSVPSTVGFKTHNYTTSFYFDFSLSKTIYFFQPFLNARFVQSINYNITRLNISIDMGKASASAQSLYGDGNFEGSNLKKDDHGNDVGVIVPVTDFILSGGFEFIVTIFRFGFESSFGVVSQKGMITLSLRFQVENSDFDKLRK